MNRTWKNIRAFDKRPMGARAILLFLGESIYFMLLLAGDYEEPLFLCNVSAAAMMAFLFCVMLSFTRWEQEHWRSMYEKIRYFPVDRKKYLLAKAVPAGKVFGLQIGIQVIVYLCRLLMHQEIAVSAAGGILLCSAVSGIWFFFSFLGMLAAGERGLLMSPVFYMAGMEITNGVGRILWN